MIWGNSPGEAERPVPTPCLNKPSLPPRRQGRQAPEGWWGWGRTVPPDLSTALFGYGAQSTLVIVSQGCPPFSPAPSHPCDSHCRLPQNPYHPLLPSHPPFLLRMVDLSLFPLRGLRQPPSSDYFLQLDSPATLNSSLLLNSPLRLSLVRLRPV